MSCATTVPTGRPSGVKPALTLAAGCSEKLYGAVYAMWSSAVTGSFVGLCQ